MSITNKDQEILHEAGYSHLIKEMNNIPDNDAVAECYDTLDTYGQPHDTECDECPGREECRMGW